MVSAIGSTNKAIGIGTSRFMAAAIAPMSAPALIVFATTSRKTVRYRRFLA